jgi:hypothetical protein
MAHSTTDFTQITKKNTFLLVLIIPIFLILGCNQVGSSHSSSKQWCINKVDTLWTVLTKTRENFKYSMDAIAARKESMEKELHVFSMLNGSELTEEDKTLILQYNAVLKVYKPMAGKYKHAVIEAENNFYRIKALEKSTKAGGFDKKIPEFKTTYEDIYDEVAKGYEESQFIANQLLTVEPMYLRIEPKVAELLERLGINPNP